MGSASTTASTTTPCSSSGGTDWTPSCARSSGCGASRAADAAAALGRPGQSTTLACGLRTGRFPANEAEPEERIAGSRCPRTDHGPRRHCRDDVALGRSGDRSDCPTSPRPSMSAAWRGSASRSPRPWNTPISKASCTATSSPPTSCWTPRARSGSPTSAWPRPRTATS